MTADVFIIVVVSISIVIGMLRGMTKEILSLFSWAGAISLTIIIFPYAKDIARQNISHGLIADFVTACALFVLFLTILSILNYMCSNFVKKSALSGVDKFLGGVFGILRGVILLAIIDITACQWIISADAPPQWITESKLRPQVMKVANFLILVMPNTVQDKLVSHMSALNKANLIKFIKGDVIEDVVGSKVEEILTEEATPIAPEIIVDNEEIKISTEENSQLQEEEAKNLATLKPREPVNHENNEIATEVRKTEKERLDMQRILDTTDLDDDNV